MLRYIALAALLFFSAAFDADALEFTDAYVTPGEEGSGVLVIQSDTFQFVTFFVYGQDGKPTWYTAYLTQDATGKYTGQLYATTGSPFGTPWNPAAAHIVPVGTASFTPIDIYRGTLAYAFTGGPTVSKPVQRFPLTPYVLGGSYSGSMAGSINGCLDPAGNDPSFRARYGLAVTQVGDQAATLTFTFVDQTHNGIVCTVTGPLTHLGRLYQLNGQLTCAGPGFSQGTTSVTIDSLHPTGQGIEGHLTGSGGPGCSASLHFAAVQNVNN